ncbi:MAG: nucleotidyltransferase [Epsilonproteobacteria bacterium]|nr:MAG: nucleotidyltransferase [Campylobacterota bacterium]
MLESSIIQGYLNILGSIIKITLFIIHYLSLFGSYARGEANSESDIDIVVDLDKSTMFGLVAIKEDIEEYFKNHVDIVQIRDRMNSLLQKRIERNAIYV